MTLRARAVVPVHRPPISDGAILVANGRIRAVGRWKDMVPHGAGSVLDLGDAVLLPGLVNSHCHLDYTAMAGEFAPPRKFTDWIKLITTSKGGWTYSDFAESWLNGAKMLVRTGTTTVGDIEMSPELLPDIWSATPLRVLSFLEMTGVKSRRPPAEILREAVDKIRSVSAPQGCMGLSPHAPYSTTPELLRIAAAAARRRKWRVVTHVAESDLEFEMFVHARGEMYQWLARNQRDMSDCGLGTPVQHLERNRALHERLIAVHVNYLGPDDAALLGRRRVNVAHCPRSHSYFKHRPFPLAELDKAGVNICLGTDSLASVYKARKRSVELNMFDEMRTLASAMPKLPPEQILRMATINGACALGLAGRAGELSRSAFADIIALPFSGKIGDTFDAILHHQGNVSASMIGGRWAIAPGEPKV